MIVAVAHRRPVGSPDHEAGCRVAVAVGCRVVVVAVSVRHWEETFAGGAVIADGRVKASANGDGPVTLGACRHRVMMGACQHRVGEGCACGGVGLSLG